MSKTLVPVSNTTKLKRREVNHNVKSAVSASVTSPLLLKPRISKLMLDVRPVWISCRCLKRLSRARPRPLSSSPCVRTPSRVDFPESTFPSTATRRSKNFLDPQQQDGGEGKRLTSFIRTKTQVGQNLTCWSSGTFRTSTSAIFRVFLSKS